MEVDLRAVQARIEKLRQEISALIAADKENRVRGSLIGWEDRKQHETRLARIQEIKEEQMAECDRQLNHYLEQRAKWDWT
jgi:hypothetical protein